MNLLIGCPVLARGWIVRQWVEHAQIAAAAAGVKAEFLLLGGLDDRDTWDVVDLMGEPITRVYTDEPRTHDQRDWIPARMQRMVELRNELLTLVRNRAPELFLSLDSDILLADSALTSLLETMATDRFDAVGGYTFMSRSGFREASYAQMRAPGVLERRHIPNHVIPCDVIMGIKLMTPKAYAVDYEFHRKGEDVGWSLACKARGVRIGVDARVVSKHVMEPPDLHKTDARCGF